jgi:hypothetical protein
LVDFDGFVLGEGRRLQRKDREQCKREEDFVTL